MSHPVLDLDFAPSIWLIGPSDDHPFDTWLPAAVEQTLHRFGLPAGPGETRDIVTEILTRIGTYEDMFTYFVLHWPSAMDQPTPIFLGLHERVDTDTVEDWLGGVDLSTVEQPVIDEIPVERDGVTLRRSLPYSNAEDGAIVVGARYAVDTGHPDMIILARTASFEPARVLAVQDDAAVLLSTARVVDWDGPDQ